MTILTRCFGPDSPAIVDVSLDEPWTASAGDVLVLMSNQAFHALGQDAVLFLCATIIDPQQLAEELADGAFAGDVFYSAVHVTRFESMGSPVKSAARSRATRLRRVFIMRRPMHVHTRSCP